MNRTLSISIPKNLNEYSIQSPSYHRPDIQLEQKTKAFLIAYYSGLLQQRKKSFDSIVSNDTNDTNDTNDSEDDEIATLEYRIKIISDLLENFAMTGIAKLYSVPEDPDEDEIRTQIEQYCEYLMTLSNDTAYETKLKLCKEFLSTL